MIWQELIAPRKWAVFLDLDIWRFLWTGLQVTLAMAAIAGAASLVLGLILALMRLSRVALLRYPAAAYVETIRALPVLVLIFFTFFAAARAGLGLDAFGAGTLALALYTGAVNAEIMRAGILSIERGQVEAARSLGLTYAQTMRFIVLPQALRRMVPPQVSQLITLIKDTSLAAVIGVGELTWRARILYQSPEFSPPHTLFITACVYFVVNYSLSRLSRRWEVATGAAGPAAGAAQDH